MKILKAHAGILTNFEVLDFLRSKGASADPTQRVMSNVTASEYKVFDYLVTSAACNQTRECIDEFAEKSKEFQLAKADIVNIVNNRPSSDVETVPMIENWEERMGEGDRISELVEMVNQVLPPHPNLRNPEEEAAVDDCAQATD